MLPRRLHRPGLAIVALLCAVAPLRGDALRLKGGGELRGEILPPAKPSPNQVLRTPETLTIRTLAGPVVTIDRAEVEEMIRRRPLLEEYETRRREVDDTVAAQWELAEWCRQNSLSRQRGDHLTRIVELDPEHAEAHRGLGHVRHDGRWTTKDDIMTSRGYVKYKGKFVLPQELELIQEDERASEAEKAWFRKVRLWEGWLDSDRPERLAEGLDGLKGIRDPDAVAALERTFRNDPNEQKRLLYVEILTKIEGNRPLGPLVQQSLRDESLIVRNAAIAGVRTKDVAAAIPVYLKTLKNSLNLYVNRAAIVLGQLGDKTVIPHLIDALVTRHRYRIQVPDNSAISMGTDGSFGGSGVALPPEIAAQLATGQLPNGVNIVGADKARMKWVTIQRDEQNPSALAALNLLSGEDFGYDEPSWRVWFKRHHAGQVKPKKKSPSVK